MLAPRDDESTHASDLEEPLRDLARLAQHAVVGADGVGLTVLEGDVRVMGTSNLFATAVDRVQYGGGEGPCLEAVDRGETIVSGSIGLGEGRWPHFTRDVKLVGIHSALSLPLRVHDSIIGSLNIYGRAPNAFSPTAVALAEEFAHPAAESLSTARLLVGAMEAAASSGTVLADRATVEIAVGVLIARYQLSPDQAHQRLVDTAESLKVTVVTAATQIRDREGRP